MHTGDLITELAKELPPVRRVWHPAVATTIWAALAVSVIGAVVLMFGPRPDLAQRFSGGFDLPQLLTAAATGLLACFAAFQLALPDRDWRWALMPLPAALAWLVTMAWGSIHEVVRFGPEALRLTTSFPCLAFITGLSVPLTLGLLWFARHAALVRPGPVAALGGLSAAALASTGLTCVHHLNAATMVLVWHGGAVLAVTALALFCGPRLMRLGSGPAVPLPPDIVEAS